MSINYSSRNSTGLGIVKEGYHAELTKEQRIEILNQRIVQTQRRMEELDSLFDPKYWILQDELRILKLERGW